MMITRFCASSVMRIQVDEVLLREPLPAGDASVNQRRGGLVMANFPCPPHSSDRARRNRPVAVSQKRSRGTLSLPRILLTGAGRQHADAANEPVPVCRASKATWAGNNVGRPFFFGRFIPLR